MDDEEEDMFRPISQHWGAPCMGVKYEDRAAQATAGQSPVASNATASNATSQTHNNNNSISINNTLPCRSQQQQFHILLHGKKGA